MLIPLSPNEEADHVTSHRASNRLRRLQEVRRQAREFQASQLTEYRRAQTASVGASEADKRRRELLTKTAELQRLRALRLQAMRDLEIANRDAQVHASRTQSKRDLEDLKLANFETREATRAAKALVLDRAVRESEISVDGLKFASLAASKAAANATARAFVAPPASAPVDVEAVLGNAKRVDRKFRFLELAEEISDLPHEAKTEPPQPTAAAVARASERGRAAREALETRTLVAEVSEEIKQLQTRTSETKVKTVVEEQGRRIFRRPDNFRSSTLKFEPEIEIFVPKNPPPVPAPVLAPVLARVEEEISDPPTAKSPAPSSKLSEASLDALVNRYSEILRNFRATEDPGEELVTSWDFNK